MTLWACGRFAAVLGFEVLQILVQDLLRDGPGTLNVYRNIRVVGLRLQSTGLLLESRQSWNAPVVESLGLAKFGKVWDGRV